MKLFLQSILVLFVSTTAFADSINDCYNKNPELNKVSDAFMSIAEWSDLTENMIMSGKQWWSRLESAQLCDQVVDAHVDLAVVAKAELEKMTVDPQYNQMKEKYLMIFSKFIENNPQFVDQTDKPDDMHICFFKNPDLSDAISSVQSILEFKLSQPGELKINEYYEKEFGDDFDKMTCEQGLKKVAGLSKLTLAVLETEIVDPQYNQIKEKYIKILNDFVLKHDLQ